MSHSTIALCHRCFDTTTLISRVDSSSMGSRIILSYGEKSNISTAPSTTPLSLCEMPENGGPTHACIDTADPSARPCAEPTSFNSTCSFGKRADCAGKLSSTMAWNLNLYNAVRDMEPNDTSPIIQLTEDSFRNFAYSVSARYRSDLRRQYINSTWQSASRTRCCERSCVANGIVQLGPAAVADPAGRSYHRDCSTTRICHSQGSVSATNPARLEGQLDTSDPLQEQAAAGSRGGGGCWQKPWWNRGKPHITDGA